MSVGLGLVVALDLRLAGLVENGPRAYSVRTWLAISVPIFVVEAFYYLLNYSDVIVLKQFRSADDVAIYYAAAKTIALVSFIYYSVPPSWTQSRRSFRLFVGDDLGVGKHQDR